MGESNLGTLLGKLKHEFMKALPPTIFFFVILHVVIIRALMVRGSGISLLSSASVLIASLILNKHSHGGLSGQP